MMRLPRNISPQQAIEAVIYKFSGQDIWIKFIDACYDGPVYFKFDTPRYFIGNDGLSEFRYIGAVNVNRVFEASLRYHEGVVSIDSGHILISTFLNDYTLVEPIDTLSTAEIMEQLTA